MIILEFTNRTQERAFSRAFVQRASDAARAYLKVSQEHTAEIGVVFIGPTAMRTLNRTRRGIDAPTDVLSFPLHMQPIEGYTPIVLGDLFICPSIVRRKAIESKQSAQRQMAWTIIHGLLHLAGYSHAAMRPHETAILKTLSL